MTDPPQGRDGSPSTAALAVRVDGLRRELESLATKVDVLTVAQQAHTTVLNDVAHLRSQVEQILVLLAEQDARSPAAWFWLTMTEQERIEKHGELLDWVESVLRRQYPDYLADRIRPCWPNHPEARWELACLYQLWSLAYLVKRPAPRDAADWHDRWSPGVIRRLSEVMRRCEGACQRQSDLGTAGDGQRRIPL